MDVPLEQLLLLLSRFLLSRGWGSAQRVLKTYQDREVSPVQWGSLVFVLTLPTQ